MNFLIAAYIVIAIFFYGLWREFFICRPWITQKPWKPILMAIVWPLTLVYILGSWCGRLGMSGEW